VEGFPNGLLALGRRLLERKEWERYNGGKGREVGAVPDYAIPEPNYQ